MDERRREIPDPYGSACPDNGQQCGEGRWHPWDGQQCDPTTWNSNDNKYSDSEILDLNALKGTREMDGQCYADILLAKKLNFVSGRHAYCGAIGQQCIKKLFVKNNKQPPLETTRLSFSLKKSSNRNFPLGGRIERNRVP